MCDAVMVPTMRSGAAVPKMGISSVQAMWSERHPTSPLSSSPWLNPVSIVVLGADKKMNTRNNNNNNNHIY